MEYQLKLNAVDALFTCLKLTGWTYESSWGLVRTSMQMCSTIVSIGFIMIPFSIEFIELKEQIANRKLEVVFLKVGVIPVGFAGGVTALYFIFKTPEYHKFNVIYKEAVALAFEYAPKISAEKHEPSRKFAKSYIFYDLFIYEFFFSLWCIPPLVEIFLRYPDVDYERVSLLYGDERYGFEKKTNFWLIYTIQVIHGYFTIAGRSFGNSIAPVLCLLVEGQTDILISHLEQSEIRNSDDKSFQTEKVTQQDIARDYDEESKVDKTLQNQQENLTVITDVHKLTSCIKHHQLLLRLVQIMRSVLTPFLFLELSISGVSAANFALVFTVFELDFGRIIMIGSTAVMFLSLLTYSVWRLEQMAEKLRKIGFVSYTNHKYLSMGRSKQDCLLMVTRAQHREKFSALITSGLKMHDVQKLLKMAWNYILFIQAITT